MSKAKLRKAVENGDVAQASLLLKDRENPNFTVGKEIGTLLHFALLMNQWEIAKKLIEYGADVDLPNREGETPLMSACLHGQSSIIEQLLDRGAKVNEPTK